jgi:hypothetical protein
MRLTSRIIVAATLAGSLVMGTQSPAAADYSNTVNAVGGGARVEYTVLQLSHTLAWYSGVLRDTAADGRCAWVKVSVIRTFGLRDVVLTVATVCGKGNSKRIWGNASTLGGPVIRGLKFEVCRSNSAGAYRTGCQTNEARTLTR